MSVSDLPAPVGTFTIPEELSADYMEFFRVLPLSVEADRVRVAATGEPAAHVIEDLESLFHLPLEIVPIDEAALLAGIRRATSAGETVVELVKGLDGGNDEQDDPDLGSLADARDLARQPPVVRFVSLMIREGAAAGASDIHLDATREGLRLRLRVDGVLSNFPGPPRQLQAAVVSRLKLLAELDIAERRAPQDGRIRVRLDERELDLRVATVPTHFGESVTLRLLDSARGSSRSSWWGRPARASSWSRASCIDSRRGVVCTTSSASHRRN